MDFGFTLCEIFFSENVFLSLTLRVASDVKFNSSIDRRIGVLYVITIYCIFYTLLYLYVTYIFLSQLFIPPNFSVAAMVWYNIITTK